MGTLAALVVLGSGMAGWGVLEYFCFIEFHFSSDLHKFTGCSWLDQRDSTRPIPLVEMNTGARSAWSAKQALPNAFEEHARHE